MTTDEEKAKTLFNALFNQELARTGSIKAAKDGAAILFYKDIIEHEVAEARASALKEARKELIRLSQENKDYDWVVRRFDEWIAAKLRKEKEK